MKVAITICTLIACVVAVASARPAGEAPLPPAKRIVAEAAVRAVNTTVSLSHNGAVAEFNSSTTATNATAKGEKRCCGFLCLSSCTTAFIKLHCRCIRGCRFTWWFALAQHRNDDRYCANRTYNKGDMCQRNLDYPFNYSYTYEVLRTKWVYVNKKGYAPNDQTITLVC